MGEIGHFIPAGGRGWTLQNWTWDRMDTAAMEVRQDPHRLLWLTIQKGTAPPTTALLPFANNNLQRPRRPKLGRAAQLTLGDIISVQQAAPYLAPANVTGHTWGCTLPPWYV